MGSLGRAGWIVIALLLVNILLVSALLWLELTERAETRASRTATPRTGQASPAPVDGSPTVPVTAPTSPLDATVDPAIAAPGFLRGADIIPDSLLAGVGATPAALSSAAAGPTPTAGEAEQVVRAYFAAVEADDYDAVRVTTSGTARRQTDELIASIEQQEEEGGADADLRVADLAMGEPMAGRGVQSIDASFRIQAYVSTFLGDFKAEDIPSSASFQVARVAEGVRIVNIVYEDQP